MVRTEPYRVMILSVSAGTGHLRAAEALAKACAQYNRIGEIINVDALTYTNKLFRDFMSKFYLRLVRSAPTFLGWWYDRLDEPWKTAEMRLMLNRLNTGPLVDLIREKNPDITICTHFLPAEIISHLISRRRIDARLSIVVTDYEVHAMWLSRAFHHYFVAVDECRAHLSMLGLPEDRVTVSGIPVDPVFAERRDRREMRLKHGLHPDLPTILVSAGAVGIGAPTQVVRVLGRLRTPAQIAVICGRNEELRAGVQAAVNELDAPHLSFSVHGFTREMEEWMAAADIFVGKPGGLTTAEATASGLPMMIYQPIPGQEERNSDMLLEHGAAVKCNQLTTMAFKLDELLREPGRLRRMAAAARRLGRPYAAFTVVETLLSQFDETPVRLPRERRKRMAEMGRKD